MNEPRGTEGSVPMQYVVARVRDALAHDTRVAALDLQVRIVGADLYLTGMVSSAPRRDAAEAVVRAEVPHLKIHNQLDVLPGDAPTGREEIT
jgi:osmotically-inducible protein OsmY